MEIKEFEKNIDSKNKTSNELKIILQNNKFTLNYSELEEEYLVIYL
jgi:hypothetical protein